MENNPFRGPVDVATLSAFARYASDMRKRATQVSSETPQSDLVVWFGIGRVRLFSGPTEIVRLVTHPSWPFAWAIRLSSKSGEPPPSFSCTELERMIHVLRYSYTTSANDYSEIVAWIRRVDKHCAERDAADPERAKAARRPPLYGTLFDDGPLITVRHSPYRDFSTPANIYTICAKPCVVGELGHVSLDFGIDIIEKCFSDACETAAAWLAQELGDAIPVYLGEGPPTQPWERAEKIK